MIIVSDEAVHLLFSANRWEMKSEIEKLIKSGQTVIVDRYSHSGIAYSLAKGLPLDFCLTSDKGLPKPDLILYFNCNPTMAAARAEYGVEKYEKLEFQTRVYEEFKRFWKEFEIIDAEQSIENVTREVEKLVRSLVSSDELKYF